MARDKKAKPKYESPVVLPLGEVARGFGGVDCTNGGGPQAACHSGTGPTHAPNCTNGTNASSCNAGNIAAAACPQGNTPFSS